MAAALAARLGLRLVLVHARPAAPLPPLPVLPHRMLDEAHDQDDAARDAGERVLADVLREVGRADTRVRAEVGAAPERLAAVAEEEDAELLVLGTHGDGAVRATLLGSVTSDAVGLAPCPVLVVPPGLAQDEGRWLEGESVVCGVETAADADRARLAARLARALDARVVLAHVLGRGDRQVHWSPPATAPPVDPRDRGSARAVLADVVDSLGEEGIEPAGVRVLSGEAGDQLVALSAAERAALVVVGSRGRGPLAGGLLGSTSRHLARHATVPVAICGVTGSRTPA